jgi:hypothetical protein
MSRGLWLGVATVVLLASGPALADNKGGKKATLVLKVGPDPTEIFVDEKKKGTSDKVHELSLDPGPHIVKLVHNGDEHEDQVILKKGTTTTFEWKFEDDRPKPATDDGSSDNAAGSDPAAAPAGGDKKK